MTLNTAFWVRSPGTTGPPKPSQTDGNNREKTLLEAIGGRLGPALTKGRSWIHPTPAASGAQVQGALFDERDMASPLASNLAPNLTATLASDLTAVADLADAGGLPADTAEAAPTPLREDSILTRALRSHQLWLTLTYLGLLVLMGRGLAG